VKIRINKSALLRNIQRRKNALSGNTLSSQSSGDCMEYFANCCGCCDPPPEECCIPSPCIDLEITFENTSIDGTYWAEWFPDEEPLGWRLFQEETGDCIWRIRANDPVAGGANSVVELGPLLLSVGGETIVGPIDGKCSRTINLNFGDFCGVQTFSNATMTIAWAYAYPQYFKLITELDSINICDCDNYLAMELSIGCEGSPNSLTYFDEVDTGPCFMGMTLIWDCTTRSLSLLFQDSLDEGVQYSLSNFSLTDLSSLSPITLTKNSSASTVACDFPAEIEIQGFNYGDWCGLCTGVDP